MFSSGFTFLLIPLFLCFLEVTSLNYRPIIGILTQENGKNTKLDPYGESYVQAAYVKFLQSGGARVVPIKVQQPESYYYDMFKRINGLLLPGGQANNTSGYIKIAKLYFYLAIQANLAGDYFPIWGSCLGLQSMVRQFSSRRLLTYVKAYNYAVKLELYPGFRKSRIFRTARPHIISALRKRRVSNLNHKFGISYEKFTADEKLMDFYQILSTNTDRLGTRIVTAVEAYDFPFWGIQFHPEKTAFVWEEKFRFKHTRQAVEVSQFFGNFFVDQARRSNHSYRNRQMELDTVIQNYQPVFPKIFYPFEEVYMFNVSTNVIEIL